MKNYSKLFISLASMSVICASHAQDETQSLTQPEDLQITTSQAGTTTVKEFHAQGQTYKVEFAPENTPAYQLTDQDGNGRLSSSNTSIDTDLVVPQWSLGNW